MEGIIYDIHSIPPFQDGDNIMILVKTEKNKISELCSLHSKLVSNKINEDDIYIYNKMLIKNYNHINGPINIGYYIGYNILNHSCIDDNDIVFSEIEHCASASYNQFY